MITELLNIKYPIIQGAMARIADASLASAVSNAGGLGIIATGGLTKEEVSKEIDKCNLLTDKPFGVNIMLMDKNKDEIVDLVIEKKIKVVTTGAGNPAPYIDKLKEANIIIIPVVPSVKIAKKMELLGVDAVIGEGMEAGGHIGNTTTMALIPQIVDNVSIPVIAAGGIADGRGLAAVVALGAKGVQIGTRFLLTEECNIDDKYKEILLQADDTSTTVTGLIAGVPVRSIKNYMTEEYIKLEKENKNKEELEHLTMGSLQKAVTGDVINGSLMSGQIVGLIKEIKPVSKIIEEIMIQYSNIINEKIDF